MSDEISEFLGEQHAKTKAAVAWNEVQEKEASDYPIRLDAFDQDIIEEMRDSSTDWRTIENHKRTENKDFDKAMDTFFGAFWKPRPEEVEDLSKTGKNIKSILDTARELPEWKQLKEMTNFDDVASAIATCAISRTLVVPESDEKGEGDEPGEGNGQNDQARRELRKAIEQARAEVETQQDADSLGWGNDASEVSRVPAKERIKLGRQLRDNKRLRILASLVGKYRKMAGSIHRRKAGYQREQIADIKLGDDLFSLLPQELALLADEKLKLYFMVQYAEKSLLQYEFRSNEKVGKGPIIARIDCSGSMLQPLQPGIVRIDWAVAATLALSVIAQKEKRDLNIAFFNSGIQNTWTFPQGKLNPEDVTTIATYSAGGGTSFDRALTNALDTLDLLSEKTQPDIIMITDGDAELSEEVATRCKEYRAKRKLDIFSLFVGHGQSDSLVRISQGVQWVHNLIDGDHAADLLYSI